MSCMQVRLGARMPDTCWRTSRRVKSLKPNTRAYPPARIATAAPASWSKASAPALRPARGMNLTTADSLAVEPRNPKRTDRARPRQRSHRRWGRRREAEVDSPRRPEENARKRVIEVIDDSGDITAWRRKRTKNVFCFVTMKPRGYGILKCT